MWFSTSLTKLENNSTVYNFRDVVLKKKKNIENFHVGRQAVGISPEHGDQQVLCCLSPPPLPQICPGAGDQVGWGGAGEGPGVPTGPDRTAGSAGTCHKGLPRPATPHRGAGMRPPPAGSSGRHGLNL